MAVKTLIDYTGVYILLRLPARIDFHYLK